MNTRPSGEQQTTDGAKTAGLSATISAFQSFGQLGGFESAQTEQAQAHDASKAAKRRILAEAAGFNKSFVV
jgi:hypothetical protein